MIMSVPASEASLCDYQIFDVRSKAEWRDTGVIKGSVLLSFNLSNGSPNPDFLSEFKRLADTSRPIAIICAAGLRSAAAANLIKAKLGIETTNLKGGLYKLLEEGFQGESYHGQDLSQG